MKHYVDHQYFKYIMVGIGSTLLNFGVFIIGFTIIGVHYLIASAIGFLSGVCFGYFFNKRWTFGVQKGSPLLGLYYVLVYTMSLVLSLFFFEWLVVGWNMYPPLAKCMVVVFAVMVNFIGLKCWVFR